MFNQYQISMFTELVERVYICPDNVKACVGYLIHFNSLFHSIYQRLHFKNAYLVFYIFNESSRI